MENQNLSKEQTWALVNKIARKLDEKGTSSHYQIAMIVQHCGIDLTHAILKEALDIEAQGGMMLPDNSRRRTPGGVFFQVARIRMGPELSQMLFARRPKKKKKPQAVKPQEPNVPEVVAPSVVQTEVRAKVIESRVLEQGEISKVKVTLIGRPGKIEMRKDLVVTTMTHAGKTASLPKGVPPLPSTPTVYTVYIGSKQWQKVKEAISNPEDILIIEGMCALDPAIPGIAVYTTSITTRILDMKRREEQKGTTEDSGNGAALTTPSPAKPKHTPQNAPKSENAPPVQIPHVNITIPPGMPAEEAQKLSGLYASAALFRQKIATIQAKPTEQQSGLEMTQKLLKGIEDQITTLEKKYR